MVWLPWKPGGDEEAGLKLGRLRPGRARGPRRLVPWWVGAMRRAKAASVMHAGNRRPVRAVAACGGGWRHRACTDGAAWSKPPSGAIGARAPGSGTRAIWRASMPSARRERGRGFDASIRESRYGGSRAGVGARRRVDVVTYRIAGRRRADGFTRARARPGGGDGAGPGHTVGVGRDRSSQHRQRARSPADSGRAGRRSHAHP